MDEKLINTTRLNFYGFKLWERVKALLNTYVHKTKENIISGKTILFDGYVAGGAISILNNTNATLFMGTDTMYSGSPSMSAPANTMVSYLTIGMEETLNVGDLATGCKVGVISASTNTVIEHLYTNEVATVQATNTSLISSSRMITIPVQKSWNESVYFMVGAKGMKWHKRATGMTDLTFGGNNGMPSVGSVLSPNTANYIGQVIIHGQETSLNTIIEKVINTPTLYTIGEYKTLAFDGGDRVEVGGHTWLKCDGSSVNSNDYSELFNLIGNDFGGSGDIFNLPNLTGRVLAMASTNNGESLGTSVGNKTYTLTEDNMPQHSHVYRDSLRVSGLDGNGTGNDANNLYLDGNTLHSSTQKITETAGSANPTPINLLQPTLYGGYIYICAK